MSQPVRYVATIAPVREVSLLGTADRAYWQTRLDPAGLSLAEHEGRAQVLISGVGSRFLGLPFCELSISLLVSPLEGESASQAAYLTHAYNSSRLLAWSERVFFDTPYFPADVHVEIDPHPSIRFALSASSLTAEMATNISGGPRPAARSTAEVWEGAIYLPLDTARRVASKVFYAKLSGQTQAFPFDPAIDRLALQPAGAAAPQALADSGFTGREWLIRDNATHARSKTYSRSRLPGSTDRRPS